MRRLVMGDIHGGLRGLEQVLERAVFNKKKDRLIFLGDVVDGWRETTECIRLLKTIPNLISIRGNHDDWCQRWLGFHLKDTSCGLYNDEYRGWLSQGGLATLNSIKKHESHREVYDFLTNMKSYHEMDGMLFVHGGVDPEVLLSQHTPGELMWNRSLVKKARYTSVVDDPISPEHGLVFVGHTPTVIFGEYVPTKYSNVWMMDTGASYDGPLSIMDIDTKQVFQSDNLVDLYKGETAR